MAMGRLGALGLGVWAWIGLAVGALGAGVTLREEAREKGPAARVVATLTARGLYRPEASAGGGKPAKPLSLNVSTRLELVERVIKVDADGRPRRSVRKVEKASAAVAGEVRPLDSQLRPEVAVLVAERRERSVVVFSPGGPLTRSELELVQGPADPLDLPALLPGKPVAVGDRWALGDEAARALSGYDALATNRLGATLEKLDEATAHVRLTGEVRGALLGGEGAIKIAGTLEFDRAAKRVARLELNRSEVRKAGPVEAGLEVQSTLTVVRSPAEAPPELTDNALAALPTEAKPFLELLLLDAPEAKFTLLHDRDWHLFWDDARQSVLKRLDHGEVVAQCNLAVGPPAGRGRHQDLDQFREDIRRALGARFERIIEAGEVAGPPEGGFRYKVAVQGHEGDAGILWDYYLLASPDGDQVLATFTLHTAQARRFADQDLQLIGSFQWKAARARGD